MNHIHVDHDTSNDFDLVKCQQKHWILCITCTCIYLHVCVTMSMSAHLYSAYHACCCINDNHGLMTWKTEKIGRIDALIYTDKMKTS